MTEKGFEFRLARVGKFISILTVMAIGLSAAQADTRSPSSRVVRIKAGPAGTNNVEHSSQWHSVKVTPTPGLPKIHFYDKLNPVWWFKNRDDPRPPAWYRPHSKWRKTTWYFRNPFHNFSYYVIGIADKKFKRSGRYPEKISDPHNGWNYSVAKYKWLRLPCISYHRGKVDFYVGWRDRGNFGMKMNFNGVKNHTAPSERPVIATGSPANYTVRPGP